MQLILQDQVRVPRCAAAVLALAAAGPIMASAQQAPAAAPLVFDSVTVVDVKRGTLVPNQRVVIIGTHILTVGRPAAVKIPQQARVVAAQGRYLIPGLWDMHVHYQNDSADAPDRVRIAYGITGVRNAGSAVALNKLLQRRRETLAGRRVGPRQILSGPYIEQPVAACHRSESTDFGTCVQDSADARHVVDSLRAAGADMIKLREISRGLYFVAAAEARRVGIPFGGHAEEVGALEASDSGARIIDHGLQGGHLIGKRLHELCWNNSKNGQPSTIMTQCQQVADRLRHNGTWVVPTLFRFGGDGLRAHTVGAHAFEAVAAFWADSVHSTNRLHAAAAAVEALPRDSTVDSLRSMYVIQRVGLPILAGTDEDAFGPGTGFILHAELAMYVAEGLTPLKALQSATLNPAKALNATDSMGTVAAGKLADLVLLDANPLVDITNTTTIRAVVANGHYFARATLDGLLAEAKLRLQHDLDGIQALVKNHP